MSERRRLDSYLIDRISSCSHAHCPRHSHEVLVLTSVITHTVEQTDWTQKHIEIKTTLADALAEAVDKNYIDAFEMIDIINKQKELK